MRENTSQIDALTDVWSSLNCERAVGMDPSHVVGAMRSGVQFAGADSLEMDLVPDVVVVVSSLGVLASEILID